MKIKLVEQAIEVPDEVGAEILAQQASMDENTTIIENMLRNIQVGDWSYRVEFPIRYEDGDIDPIALDKIKELRDDFANNGSVEEAGGLDHAIDILEGKE